MSEWPQKFLHAFKELHHYESITAEQEGLTLEDAYDVQHQYVHLRKEPITGFKAALTASAAQAAMGVVTPIIGALFAGGHVDPARPIALDKPCLLETEIGFTLSHDITSPVKRADVLDAVDAWLPMIEIASPNLATKPNGLDLIATNAASHQYIAGPPQPISATRLDALSVQLERGTETLLSGLSGEVMEGQQDALAWLINEMLERDYTPLQGQILMTGAIGGMIPAQPGRYVASFEDLGNIKFEIA